MRAAQAIFDRAAELAAIEELLERAATGAGGVLLIEGPPGVGKTTLTGASVRAAEARGIEVLAATGSPLETAFPFGGARQLFERRLSEAGEAERARLLEGVAGNAADVLGVGAGAGPSGEALTVVHALYWVAANLAAGGPLLLAVDDAHWLDHGSLRFVEYLARRADELPIALVIATRPVRGSAGDPSLKALLAAAPPLHPGPLSRESVSAIVRRVLGTEPDDAFVAACEEASGGNAMLVGELVRSLAEAGVPPTADGAAKVEAAAPAALRRRVTAILTGLDPEPRALAHAVGILGECDLELAAGLARLGQDGGRSAIPALEASGLLAYGSTLRFAHPLIATAVAADLPESDRSALHARAARLRADAGASADSVAAQLLATAPTGDRWAVVQLRDAARGAVARSAPETAVAYLQRGLAEPPDPRDLGPMLLELGTAQLRSGRSKDASVSLLRGLATTPQDATRYHLVRTLARALTFSADFHAAADVLEEERERLGDDDPRSVKVDGQLLELALLDVERRARLLDRRRRYDELAHAGGLDDPVLLVLLGSASLLAAQPRDEGVALIRRALGAIDVWEDQGDLFGWVCNSFDIADMAEQSVSLVTPLLAESRARGDAAMSARLLGDLTHSCYRIGRLAEAESHAWAATELLRGLDGVTTFPNPLLDVLIERGAPARAAELVATAHDEGLQQRDAMVMLMRGRVAAANGETEDALGMLLAAGEDLDTLRFLHPRFAPWRGLAAPLAAQLGDRWLAGSLAEENLELARRTQTPSAIAAALRVSGMVTGDIASLQESCMMIDSHPDLLEAARSWTELGAALLGQDRPEDAREPLRRGLAVARSAGAVALAERATGLLREAGGSSERAPLTGVESLTPSELQVARLAAQGMSDRQIAQALFITLRTVERHAGRACAKLGAPDRSALGALLRT